MTVLGTVELALLVVAVLLLLVLMGLLIAVVVLLAKGVARNARLDRRAASGRSWIGGVEQSEP